MTEWVLDASAALALILDEPGAEREWVPALIADWAWQTLDLGIEVQLIR
jgi:PIN domain nuclease of toxin-antitoxin system